MISILIPTYNFVCVRLATDLSQQCCQLKQTDPSFDFEICVADDASTDTETIRHNRAINRLPGCRFVECRKNRGRSLLLNALIEQAKFPFNLIIDADAAVCTPDFIRSYWQVRHKAAVICGSLRNPATACPQGHELRYRYEHHAEQTRRKQGSQRDPYFHFSTFNVLINQEAIDGLRFDTRCLEYGYEDALFGLTMKERGLSVAHADIPLIHTGIDTNDAFLAKTEAALRTLSRLDGLMQDFAGPSRLYAQLKRWHAARVFSFLFTLIRPLIRHNLLSRHPSLFLFHVYKLGYYTRLQLNPQPSSTHSL